MALYETGPWASANGPCIIDLFLRVSLHMEVPEPFRSDARWEVFRSYTGSFMGSV